MTSTQPSTLAAASRARSTADRIAELRARLDRLVSGEPTTPQDARRARELAQAQAQALSVARDRLVEAHRSSAMRHEENAWMLARAGRAAAAARALEAAGRAHAAADRYLALADPATPAGLLEPVDVAGACGLPAPAALGAVTENGQVPASAGTSEEILRLRQGLTAALSWAGGVDQETAARRQAWCRCVLARCGTPEWRGWMHAVCLVAAAAWPWARGAAITVATRSGVEFATASDDWSSRAQDLEFLVGEGPSVTAIARGRVVVVDDLATERHAWQGFASAGSDLDLRGVCALPLRVGGPCVGALTLYFTRSAGVQAAAHLAEAIALADIAAAVLLADLDETGEAGPAADGLLVHAASGGMAVRWNIPPEEAEARLRAYAFRSDISLVEAARQVLRGEADLA